MKVYKGIDTLIKTKMYNRNETNGKYRIWGHDIADLVLTEIRVYETSGKKLVLVLNTLTDGKIIPITVNCST